jgi:F420-dependent oxidoreductase-like protein
MLNTNAPIADVTDQVRQVADAGLHTAVSSQIFAYDALTLLAVVGQQVPGVELATGVVPTYPRHPYVLAVQALTVQAATGGRLVLGIGLSHQPVIEGMFGYSFDKPARHMREYLDVLLPLLRGEQVSYQGETLSVSTFGPIEVMAPRMLRMAGGVADGTMTWMTGPTTVASHITPSITAAAEAAGRPAPRVVVGLPVCVTSDVGAARERAARDFVTYGYMPSYRAMLDREGAEGPADVVVVGDEEAVAAQLATVAEAGATDFVAAPFGGADDRARTFALLTELAARS